MLRPAAAFRPPHKHGTQIKKKRLRHHDAVPAKNAGGVLDGSKVSTKKKAALKPSFLVGGGRGRRQNEEDLMLGLLEEMGASMTQGEAGVKEEEEEREAPMRPPSSDEEEEDEEDVEREVVEAVEEEDKMKEKEHGQQEKPKAKTPHHSIPSMVSTIISTGSGVSPHELWNPTLCIDKATLNLPWWGSSSRSDNSTGGNSTSILALPPPPPPPLPSLHAHVEVARARGVKELADWFIGAALRPGNAADRTVFSTRMTSQRGKVIFLRRAFQMWMQDNKLRESEEKDRGRGLAVAGARRLVLTDPVLPQTAACQQDLGLAKALTGGMVSVSLNYYDSWPLLLHLVMFLLTLTVPRILPPSIPAQIRLPPEIAVELCEALGLKTLALVSTLHEQQQHPPSLTSSLPPTSTLRRKQSRLEQPPVLRSRHHAPCLYLPLSSLSDARLTLLERNEALDVSLLKGHALRINEKHYQKLKVGRTEGRGE